MFKKISFLVAVLVLVFSMAFSTVHTVPFQGTLFQSLDGTVVPNGTYTMTVKLFDNVDGTGTALWTETHTGVDVLDGSFGVYLGDTVAIPGSIAAINSLYVKVDLGGQAVANNLIPVTSHLWAQFAKVAQSANTAITANVALSLANKNISQFTNDVGFAKTVDIANIAVNTSNFATTAGALSNMGNAQFSNTAGFAKTSELAAATVSTANIALKAKALVAMNIGQFSNDTGYITLAEVPVVSSVNFATKAGSLSSMTISQFTNDTGYAKTSEIAAININTANYAVKASALTTMGNAQFTNDAGYAKTADLASATVNTANVAVLAVSMPASGLTGALTINGTTAQAQQFKAVKPYQINGFTGIDTTTNIVVNVSSDTFGFVKRTYKTLVVKGGLVVSESATFVRP